jgi:hypothetical protein
VTPETDADLRARSFIEDGIRVVAIEDDEWGRTIELDAYRRGYCSVPTCELPCVGGYCDRHNTWRDDDSMMPPGFYGEDGR